MRTLFVEIGVFNLALVLAIYFQIYSQRKKYRDCQLFSRLLLATAAILIIDTIGWLIDGKPLLGQLWFTVLIDGLNLIVTSVVCWCWVQYAEYIAGGERQQKKAWYRKLATWLLIIQVILVVSSQVFGFYYSIDNQGIYHREGGYFIHVIISMTMLFYSSFVCLKAYFLQREQEKNKELLFVASIIVLPICGNIFQFLIYGYPTVWLCMVFMIFVVYVHIQNKRMNAERENQNRKLEQALEEAQIANNAKTDFLSRMSHDMRTPMNGILGITNLLRDRTDPAEIREDVKQIENSGKYLLSLINDTLDMNKIESGKLELHPVPIDSENLLGSVLATAKLIAAQKGVELILELPPTEPERWVPVVADESRLQQIFMNIISNAVKFTPQGGSVTIHMETLEKTPKLIRDRYIISDTGIGMSEEFQKHLFEPFSQEGRTNTDHESGTGLGLAIVKRIVEMMDGTIQIESVQNQGTKITVELTYERYQGELHKEAKKAVDLSILQGKHVLLCEDHPINAQIAIRLLEKKGILVSHAENGQIGVNILKTSSPNYYDIVLMDIRMPVMNGLEATKRIRQDSDREDIKKIPIVAMTANAFDEDVRQCIEAGMNAHLSKPIDPEVLYEELARQLQ